MLSDTSETTLQSTGPIKKGSLGLLLIAIALAAVAYIFFDGMVSMESHWANADEYSHGYMIPLVALFLLWQKFPLLAKVPKTGHWLALPLMLAALIGWALGELSALFIIMHYSFLLALYALAIAIFGWRGFLVTWAAFAYLVFMIPFPDFVYQQLSATLQLISSELGVWVVRLFGISVHLEGNVIDLGSYQLQVVEACSGLRYLFPLMSFGFLIAYVYCGPLWHKWVIFISTIPITVLMNSFRIGLIGVTVDRWGVEMAEGILHDFEGWIVFMACLAVLFFEIWILQLVSRRKTAVLDLIDLETPANDDVVSAAKSLNIPGPALIASTLILLLAVPVTNAFKAREEIVPERTSFSKFPLLHDGWIGREERLDKQVLKSLELTDYITASYRKGSVGMPVNFYVAYYASQRKGASIHSPRACLPGGGWKIAQLEEVNMDHLPEAQGLTLNRAVIEQRGAKQLVYYWFQQRSRRIANEYIYKWYLFWDGLTMNRSDGALVRLITYVPESESIESADQRLQEFLKDFYPILPGYIKD